MLDTARVHSEFIEEDLAAVVGHQLDTIARMDNRTEELLWTLTKRQLEGSWETSVHCSVERFRWESIPAGFGPDGRRKHRPVKVACRPYLLVEGSVHKALLGQNLIGGPMDVQAPVQWLLSDVGRRLGVGGLEDLRWFGERFDWAEVFVLDSIEAVEEWFAGAKRASFARRELDTYGGGVYAAGDVTTGKWYHKGREMAKHGEFSRLRRFFPEDVVDEWERLAWRAIRGEFEVKLPALRGEYDCSEVPVGVIQAERLGAWYDRGQERLLKEGKRQMEKVRTVIEVDARLKAVYGTRGSGTLMGTWSKLCTLGEEAVSKMMAKATFYRHRDLLLKAGCDWKLSLLHEDARCSLVPANFAPIRTDPRRLVGEDPEVVRQLAPFREALSLAA